MANLAHREGDAVREELLRKRLEREQQSDPFFYFIQAVQEDQAGDYAQAIEHFQHAIRMHGDEPRFYASLAHAYEHTGDDRSAISALNRAKWLSDGSIRDDYAKQIEALRELSREAPRTGSAASRTNGT